MTWHPDHRRPELPSDLEPPDVAKPYNKKKKPRKKRFGIEWLAPKLIFHRGRTNGEFTWQWSIWKWYATEKQRDMALVGLNKSICNVYKNREAKRPSGYDGPRYRKVDR